MSFPLDRYVTLTLPLKMQQDPLKRCLAGQLAWLDDGKELPGVE